MEYVPAWLAAFAAFMAAGMSAWNVARSARYADQHALVAWRRDVLLPALTRYVEAVDATIWAAGMTLDAAEEMKRANATAEVLRANAQVELLGDPHVHHAAEELRDAVVTLVMCDHNMGEDRDGLAQQRLMAAKADVRQRRSDLVNAARASLGLPDSM